ncbi:MAG: 30S ribosomal protein S17 [bacterium]
MTEAVITHVKRMLKGKVVSTKMQKTIVVEVERLKRHRLYEKVLRVHKKYTAHDENGDAHEGDFVEIVESRPLSKTKRWALTRIIERAR